MKKQTAALMLSLFLVFSACVFAEYRDLYSDSWAATDALGRNLPGYKEVGPVRENRTVGIFYWTWHTAHGGQGPFDNTKIIGQNPDNPSFGPIGAAHHWGEPELGYYISTDPYVIRRHAMLLTDAGVDAIFFDTTNPPFTFKESYTALCDVYTQMLAEGNAIPKIAFICPFGDPTVTIEQLYNELYRPGLYKDLWFLWKQKPLILADPAFIQNLEIKDFFTFRKPIPTYFDGPSGPNQWGWLEVFPQHVFYGDTPQEKEQVTVGVAQNAAHGKLGPMSHKDGAYGRSWRNGKKDAGADSVLYGLNFQEQWDHALQIGPPFIFVTGWNEWVAGRFSEWAGYTGKDTYYPDAVFVDQYSQEYSRDIEPMKGGHGDNYYYQLAANIRKYKGVRPPQSLSPEKTIVIDGRFEDWNDVQPEFRDHVGDTAHRNHKGYGSLHYTDSTGRNDLRTMKVARDEDYVYFYAETASPLTPHTDPNWMLLFIDTDQNTKTGWNGYDYLVNLKVSDETTSLHTLTQGFRPQLKLQIAYKASQCGLELAILRSGLGKQGTNIGLDFKWVDNVQRLGDINEFFFHGDVAPERRFNYRCIQ